MIEHITSRQNPLLVHIRKLLNSRSYREKCGEFAGDGVKLLQEAALWDARLTAVIAQEAVMLPPLPEGVRLVTVPKDVMDSVSNMDAPQGALFVCKMPEKRELVIKPGSLILDGLQDPGNVGTILRTADALEIPVVLSDGCADAYNPKTVRATMGAIFRNPPQMAHKNEILSYCQSNCIPIYATALNNADDIRKAPLDGAVVIGSEGHGVCDVYLNAAARNLVIPMNAGCESLNASVAATIVMWEIKNR